MKPTRPQYPVFQSITRHVQILAIWLGLLFGWLQSMSAATYYVSNSGNDSNDGSLGAPWATIQKAANTMIAGDSVNVLSGDYNELVITKANGTSGNPISFVARTGVNVGGFTVNHAWQTIQGFTINGTGVPLYTGAIHVGANAHNFVCRSNTLNYTNTGYYANYLVTYSGAVTNSTYDGNFFLSTPFMGISLTGSGHLLTNNIWSSQKGGDALRLLSSNTKITGNTFTNWSDYSDGANLEHADLIQAFSNNGEVATNNIIENNLFINCINVQIGTISDYSMIGNVGSWTYRNNIWNNVSWVMTINAHDFYFFNNVFYHCGTNSGHPINFSSGDGEIIKFSSVDTNANTITLVGTNYLANGQMVQFVDPDGAANTHVLPYPLLGGRQPYYIHRLADNIITVHTNNLDATNGVNTIHLTSIGQGNVGVTGFYNRNYSHNGKVFNNIFLECGRDTTSWIQGWFGVSSTITNFQAGNNIVKGTGTGGLVPTYGSGISKNVNDIYWHESYGFNGVDPLFIDAPHGNFSLMHKSPAIGNGYPLNSYFNSDFNRLPRDDGWDIGACRYISKPNNIKVISKP